MFLFFFYHRREISPKSLDSFSKARFARARQVFFFPPNLKCIRQLNFYEGITFRYRAGPTNKNYTTKKKKKRWDIVKEVKNKKLN